MKSHFKDWWPMYVVGGILAVLFILYSIALVSAYNEFMEECLEHEPKYRCTAMYRRGNTVVAPVVVPVR